MAYLLGFNNNIRCIEIQGVNRMWSRETRFNNNIRCIEITEPKVDVPPKVRLITT